MAQARKLILFVRPIETTDATLLEKESAYGLYEVVQLQQRILGRQLYK